MAQHPLITQRLQRLQQTFQQLEFDLWVKNPDVFNSFRAAKRWALVELTRAPYLYSGDRAEWHVDIIKNPLGYECSISQHWWAADHVGSSRPTAALAIVQAVLELQAGF